MKPEKFSKPLQQQLANEWLLRHGEMMITKRYAQCALLLSLAVGMVALAGCGGGSAGSTAPTPTPTPTPGPAPGPAINPSVVAKNIYIMDLTQSTVDVYQANINGKASPSSSYPVRASAITGDSSGNLYIAALPMPTATVQIYASGSTTTSRSLTVPNTLNATQNQILTMTVDHSGYLYVAFADVIYVYAPGATGNAVPVRTITPPAASQTGFTPSQMAVDSADNLYVAQIVAPSTAVTYQLVEYPPMANGSVSPMVLAGTPAYGPSGVAIDSADNIYISQGAPYCGAPCGTYTAGIVEFAKGATAGATPLRFITGGATGFVVSASNTFVDAAGNIFVQVTQNGQENFEVFSATANGNIAPASVLIRSVGATTDFQSYIH